MGKVINIPIRARNVERETFSVNPELAPVIDMTDFAEAPVPTTSKRSAKPPGQRRFELRVLTIATPLMVYSLVTERVPSAKKSIQSGPTLPL